ncbi:MAG: sulfatase-like hydrolase/transferase [Bacteroidia bacterium]|nr:sulfatase-like hydrolase/transferase [Bacteroidia bacterium]
MIVMLTMTTLAFGQSKDSLVQLPNIILITSDQLIPHLMGTYGHPVVNTPNLDKLATSGIVFNAAYTPNPICAPARACLMTGQYSTHIKVWDNAAPLSSDEPTIGHYLSLRDYESVLSGKMHFVGPDQLHGYDKRLIPNIYPADFVWTKDRFKKIPGSHAQAYEAAAIRIVPEGTDLSPGPSGELAFKRPVFNFGSTMVVNSGFNETSHNSKFDKWAHFKALDYLREKRAAIEQGADTRPFFLTISYNYPHEPFHPPLELYRMYENAPVDLPALPDTLDPCYSAMDKWLNQHHGLETTQVKDPESIQKVRRAYYALVTYVDIVVGEIMKCLAENNFDKNTLIIFTSDHGDMLMEKGMVQKRSFYEWSSRIPLIVKFPDEAHAGMKINTPVSLIDVLPTILDVAQIPDSVRLRMDGKSLLPLIEKGEDASRYVISEMHSEGVYAPCFMVRKGDFKYIYIHGYESQLFNLKDDPGEWKNLIYDKKYAPLVTRLREVIFQHFDPEEIETALQHSIGSRQLIQQWIEKTGTSWDYVPKE